MSIFDINNHIVVQTSIFDISNLIIGIYNLIDISDNVHFWYYECECY